MSEVTVAVVTVAVVTLAIDEVIEARLAGSAEPPTLTVAAWRERALALGGGSFLDCPFVCPLCGNVATPRDFIAAGAKGSRAAQECIGRVTGAVGGLTRLEGALPPCDWAAFGLFGTLDKGVFVTMPDGAVIQAFAFGERPAVPSAG